MNSGRAISTEKDGYILLTTPRQSGQDLAREGRRELDVCELLARRVLEPSHACVLG